MEFLLESFGIPVESCGNPEEFLLESYGIPVGILWNNLSNISFQLIAPVRKKHPNGQSWWLAIYLFEQAERGRRPSGAK